MDTPKESASSPTGRLPSEPEIQFIKPPELPTYLREIMDLLANEVNSITGLDLARRPDSLGAMLVCYVDGKMEVEHLTGIQGTKADLIIIDDVVEEIKPYNLDFNDLELRTLAQLSQDTLNEEMARLYDLNPLVLGGRGHAKTEQMKRYQHGFFEVDYDPDEMRRQQMKPDIKKLAKAKKDKSYLALDPTKNHRKRRR